MNYSITCAVMLLTSALAGCHQPSDKSTTLNHLPVGGGCDGCELMYVGMPERLSVADTSLGWKSESNRLLLTGTVFRMDGRTPAANVVIYYWHTDSAGYYSPGTSSVRGSEKHGHLRGWVRTDNNGQYAIYTSRPAPYPGEELPAHIHLVVKEPNLVQEYYIDDVVFDDDPLLIPYLKKYPAENRGGSGIVRLLQMSRVLVGEHDIILGLNIPNYPEKISRPIESGLPVGEDQPSFTPLHVYGPDKGTSTCPVCKYGRHQGLILFCGNNVGFNEMKRWLTFLESESNRRAGRLKVYLVLQTDGQTEQFLRQLEWMGDSLHIRHTAITVVPAFHDQPTDTYLNQINPAATNTLVIYRNRRIVDKYINLSPDEDGFRTISRGLDKTMGDYLNLPSLDSGD